jgi:hypothetical protein
MITSGRLEERLACFVDSGCSCCGILRTNPAGQYVGKDATGMMVNAGFSARWVIDHLRSQGVARHVRELAREQLPCGLIVLCEESVVPSPRKAVCRFAAGSAHRRAASNVNTGLTVATLSSRTTNVDSARLLTINGVVFGNAGQNLSRHAAVKIYSARSASTGSTADARCAGR